MKTNRAKKLSKINAVTKKLSQPKRAPVICLCGSTKFRDEFISVQRDLSLKGFIVLSVGLFGHLEGLDMTSETKRMLDRNHKQKIDMSDGIYVINPGRYIGSSTRDEIAYAEAHGKTVEYMHTGLPVYRGTVRCGCGSYFFSLGTYGGDPCAFCDVCHMPHEPKEVGIV